MKKDIDLLSGFNEAKGKKSSSNSSLIVVVLILVVVGVLVYMFMNAKMQVDELSEQLANKQAMSSDSVKIEIENLEDEVWQNKNKYNVLVSNVLKEVYSGHADMDANKISSKFLEILYDNYATYNGQVNVQIENLTISSVNVVALSFRVKSKEDAWAFYEYLTGDLELKKPDLSADPKEKAEYDRRQKLIKNNAEYFSGLKYPGVPEDGEGEDFDVSMSLNFRVNWRKIAEYETK